MAPFVYQGTHSGTRSYEHTARGMVFRSISTYAQTVEGSGFTRELSVDDYFHKNWQPKLNYLAAACEEAPHAQGSHKIHAINFILSLAVTADGTRARMSNTHLNRLAKILDVALAHSYNRNQRFRLWVSNSGYKRDEECNNNSVKWISRKLSPYEWAEVICLEVPGSHQFNRPWLITERLLGRKSSGYWQLDDNDNVSLTGPKRGSWAEYRSEINQVQHHVDTCRYNSREQWFKDNCSDIINRLEQLKYNSGGQMVWV